MATFNSFAALERQIMKDMRSATNRAKNRIEIELFMNVNGYYNGSTPQRYQRTGTLLTSPDSTPVQGSGKHLEFSVYMDEGISYSTGTFSGAQGIDAPGRGGAGGTAACPLPLPLFHWPCSTTCLTTRAETGAWRWTALGIALPTAVGMSLCALTAAAGRLLGF